MEVPAAIKYVFQRLELAPPGADTWISRQRPKNSKGWIKKRKNPLLGSS